MLQSVESMTYNGYKFDDIFNDSPDAYFIINEVRGRGLISDEMSWLTSPGNDGSYLSMSRLKKRTLEVDITMKGLSFTDTHRRIERLNAMLETKAPVEISFADEPDRFYQGVFSAIRNESEVGFIYQATVVIDCPDPYKYGPEETTKFPLDVTEIDNDGTSPALPVFTLRVTDPVTFAMVQNEDDEYMMLGIPEEDDIEVVDTRTPVIKESGETLSEWSSSGVKVDEHFSDVSGNMIYDEIGIIAKSYGTGDRMHGPAMITEIDPIQDFEIETLFDIITTRNADNYRMEVYFFDEHMNMLGKMGIKDNTKHFRRRVGLARIGEYTGPWENYVIGKDNYTKDNLGETSPMYLRVKREGDKYTFYIAELRNSKHTSTITETYVDTAGDFRGKLKYVQLFLGSWKDRTRPWRNRVLYLNVYELSQSTEDQTPYIAHKGDTITFNHDSEELLINGEDRKELKDFGGSFFSLHKGSNELVVHPEDKFATEVTFRKRYR